MLMHLAGYFSSSGPTPVAHQPQNSPGSAMAVAQAAAVSQAPVVDPPPTASPAAAPNPAAMVAGQEAALTETAPSSATSRVTLQTAANGKGSGGKAKGGLIAGAPSNINSKGRGGCV